MKKKNKGLMILGLVFLIFIIDTKMSISMTLIKNISQNLGLYNEMKDYKDIVGVAKYDKGYKATIENIVVTPHKFIIVVRVDSIRPLDKRDINVLVNIKNFNFKCNKEINYINEHSCRVINTISRMEGDIPISGDIEITAIKTCDNIVEAKIKFNFNLNLNLKHKSNDVKTINVDKTIFRHIKLKEIEASTVETNLLFNKEFLQYGNINEYERVLNSIKNLNVTIKVDGIEHRSEKCFFRGNEGMINFPNLKFCDLKDAKDIKIIYDNSAIHYN